MVRRANRPDETFNRDRRRKGLDRSAMLEAKTRPPHTSLIERFLRKVASVFSRRRRP